MLKHLALSILGYLLLISQANAEVRELDSLTVLAEPSLALPLSEIARKYSVHKQITLLTTFSDSQSHTRQLQEGEGDVLLTAMPTMTQQLRQMGLVDIYSQTTIAGNRLVLAASETVPVSVLPLAKLLDNRPVMMAAPDRFIEGFHAEKALDKLKDDVSPEALESEVQPTLLSLYDRMRSGAGWGFMLNTETRHLPWVKSVLPLEESPHPTILYQALVVAGDKMELSRDFVKYLKSETAQNIFKRHGFEQP